MADCPFLKRCVAGFQEAGEELERLVHGLSEEQAAWRPGPKQWSIVEGVDHLNRTAEGYVPRMEAAIERGRRLGRTGSAPYPQKSFLGKMILRVLDPEAGRTFPAPKAYNPRGDSADLGVVAAEFRSRLGRLVELAELADGLDLGWIRHATPVAPWPRVTIAEAFEIHRLHIPRHLAQARAVKEAPGYPG